jgi:hypothetical protein
MDIQQLDPKVLLSQSKPEVCPNCEGNFFRQTFMFRRVSKILVGAPQDQLIPIPVFRCDDCGTPIGDMVPDANETESQTDEGKIIKMN